MAEVITLTTPVPVPSLDITTWKVVKLELNWLNKIIRIRLQNNRGEFLDHTYINSVAETFMIQLNKANLSTTSLQKRILQRLNMDGIIIGTVTGTVD